MKKITFLVVAFFAIAVSAMASDEKFVKAMENALNSMKGAKSVEEVQQVANTLERITAAEPKEWLPAYWTAYAYTIMSFMEKEVSKKDQYLDHADKFVGQTEALAPENDEVVVLKALIAQARLVVDPMNRWSTYGMTANQLFAKAKQLNPENPRIYTQQGQSVFNTPEQFGGGKKAALPIFKIAVEKYAAFKPASSIHPDWGKERAVSFLAKCEE